MSDITNYLQSIEDRIDAINTCEMLQEAATAIKTEMDGLLADLQDQSDALTLQTIVPTDLATTIVWIKAQIDATTKPILEMVAEIALITGKVSAILAKLESKIATLGCSFTPPSRP